MRFLKACTSASLHYETCPDTRNLLPRFTVGKVTFFATDTMGNASMTSQKEIPVLPAFQKSQKSW